MSEEMLNLRVSRRDAGRLLSGVRHRRKKLENGIAKFAGSFDATLGRNMQEGLAAFRALEQVLMEAMNENDHPRRAGRNPREHEGRRDAPGDYRSPR